MPTASEIYNRAKGTDSKIAADQAQLLADQAEGTVEHQELYDVVAAYPGPVVEIDADQVHAMILVNDPDVRGRTITTAAFVSTAPPPPPPGTGSPPPQPPTGTGMPPAPPTDTGTTPAPATPDTGTQTPPPPPTDTAATPPDTNTPDTGTTPAPPDTGTPATGATLPDQPTDQPTEGFTVVQNDIPGGPRSAPRR